MSSRPSIFDPTGRAKWDAWNATTTKYDCPQAAETRYLWIARELGWTAAVPKIPDSPEPSEQPERFDDEGIPIDAIGNTRRSGGSGMGITVSTLNNKSIDEGSESTIHGLAIANDFQRLTQLIKLSATNPNVEDKFVRP